ncbi:hypothetical protein OMW55_07555 [Sphingomonas sp. BN140010]|uniref:HPt domain-containing protein n=1 Tax=Sphingomonas arvum TaxID=2992113 RepID=A0ABT3JF03_9SPHN|nr:hypothetical protein [Sphingomonas sp. BN140010]MCW3797657.1 hypothetical protein [Sphingomonas sp. BN140010]
MRDSLDVLRNDLKARIADIHGRAHRLSPLDIHARLDAIRDAAGRAGLSAAEGLAGHSAQLALLPGCRVAVAEALSHFDDALAAGTADRTTILAAIAARLH